jgi:hypothetical protein
MAMRGARRQDDPLLRSGPAPEGVALLAPALLAVAVALAGVGAGGIERLEALGEIATGPAPPVEHPPQSVTRAGENIVSAFTNRSGAQRRPAAGGATRGSDAGSAPTGVADISTPARRAATPISPPTSDASSGSSGGGERLVGDPVGGVRNGAPPVRNPTAPIERVVDELLDDLERQPNRVPPALRKSRLLPED